MDMAGIAAALAREDLVAARHQPDLDRALGPCGVERMHEGVDAVVAGEGGEAEVGDDEPLGGERLVLVLADRAGGLGHHDIDAGGARADRLIGRKGGGDIGVELLLDRHLALPDLEAALGCQPLEIVAVEAGLEVAPHHAAHEVAVADAVDLELHRRGIDADHRNAALTGTRQYVGLAAEAYRRLAVAHIDAVLGGSRQRLFHHRGNAGAQRDGVALAVPKALDAELAILHRERGLVLAGDRHERGEIGAPSRQVLGELEAHARRGCVGIDGVIKEPETVLLAQALVLLPHLGDLAQIERAAQRIERGAPARAIHIGARDEEQALGLLAGTAGALVGDIGRGGRALEQPGSLVVRARPDAQDGPGDAQPARGIVGRNRHDLSENLQSAADVVALEGGIGLALQHGGRLGHRAGFGPDLGFEPGGRGGEIVALERLVGGNGGSRQQQNERGCAGSANEREHGGTSAARRRGSERDGTR